MQQAKPRLTRQQYFELKRTQHQERMKQNLDTCFNYKHENLKITKEKDRLNKKDFLTRKKAFWAFHLKDLFPTYYSYAAFIAKNNLEEFDEKKIRDSKTKKLATKQNYGYRVGKKQSRQSELL